MLIGLQNRGFGLYSDHETALDSRPDTHLAGFYLNCVRERGQTERALNDRVCTGRYNYRGPEKTPIFTNQTNYNNGSQTSGSTELGPIELSLANDRWHRVHKLTLIIAEPMMGRWRRTDRLTNDPCATQTTPRMKLRELTPGRRRRRPKTTDVYLETW